MNIEQIFQTKGIINSLSLLFFIIFILSTVITFYYFIQEDNQEKEETERTKAKKIGGKFAALAFISLIILLGIGIGGSIWWKASVAEPYVQSLPESKVNYEDALQVDLRFQDVILVGENKKPEKYSFEDVVIDVENGETPYFTFKNTKKPLGFPYDGQLYQQVILHVSKDFYKENF